MAEYVHINEIYSRYFGLNPPVRVCVQSPIKSYALIEAVAFPHLPQKRVMHIQSISHWAPANIGPYSQCIEVIFYPIRNDVKDEIVYGILYYLLINLIVISIYVISAGYFIQFVLLRR